jgi:O-antigen/teichoic acid export membrane protein
MRRFFVKNLLFVIAVNLLVKPLWVFMIDRTVQNTVGHEAYGTYQALLNICIIFNVLLDFGLTNYNTNLIAKNPEKLKELFAPMLTTRIVLAIIYSSLVFLFGWATGYRSWELNLLLGVLLIQSFNSLVLYLRSNVSALHHFKTDSVLSVMDRLLMIASCGYLLYNPVTAANFKIEWFVYAQIVCYGVTAIVAMIVIYRIAHVAPKFSFKKTDIFHNIKKSFPYAILILLMGTHMRSDMILVERLAGKDEAGIYASATRLLDVGNMFGLLFAGVLMPLFGKMISNKQSVQPIIKLSANMLLPFAFTTSIIAFLWGSDIMQLLYKNAGDYDAQIFVWVMATFPAYCIMYTYSTLLTANGNISLLNKISLAGVIISLGINLYIIPLEKAQGAAKTAFITQSILALCYIYFCHREINLPKNPKWIAAHISFVAVMALAAYLLHSTSIAWMIQIGILGIIAIVAMLVFRFLSIQGIQMLASKE